MTERTWYKQLKPGEEGSLSVYRLKLTKKGKNACRYDYAYELIICASSAREARKIAAQRSHGGEPAHIWLEPSMAASRLIKRNHPRLLLAACKRG